MSQGSKPTDSQLLLLEQICEFYDSGAFRPLPSFMSVKQGDILEATPKIETVPVFGGSKYVLLGYNPSNNSIAGTSFEFGHPAFLDLATWNPRQLEDEISQGYWEQNDSVQGSLMDYYKRLNPDL